ncbi:hypothetical protein K440DRAFT_678818, partial [Wilcoxina mikolae CBS 423.85]
MIKRWNLRKNLSPQEWKAIEHKTKKRKADDKDSDIYLNGFLVPRKKVQTGFAHHITPSLGHVYISVPSPQTPPGVIIRTPGTPLARTPGTPRDAGATGIPAIPGIHVLRLDNLPWLQLKRLLESQVGLDYNWVAQLFSGGDARVRQAFSSGPAPPSSVSSFSGSSVQAIPSRSSNSAAFASISSLFAGLVPPSVKPDSVEFIPAVHSRMQAISPELNAGEHLSTINALFGPFSKDTLSE